jgi:hypothetical protein
VPRATGFVGRNDELGILAERFAAAAMGHPQIVHLEGEAGSGKSTLLARFLGSLSDVVLLQAGGDEDEMLLSYGVVDQLEPGTSREPATDPMAVGAALLDLLDQLQSDGRAVVLAIDDLQWADRPSSRALLFALRRLRADKVLTVVSARAGGLTDPGWARFLGGDSRVTRVHLGGLSSSDLMELAGALGLGSLTYRGASRLVAHTEGNALYCRALLDEIKTGAELAFSQARSITTMAPMPFEFALLNFDDGRRLRGFGQGPAAVARLEEAHKAFSHLGADPFVQACAGELAALHVTAAPESPAKLLGLGRSGRLPCRLWPRCSPLP